MFEPRVLFINPNPRNMSLISPVVALFHSIFEREGIAFNFFDTTFYDVSDKYVNTDIKKKEILGVKDYESNYPKELTSKKNRQDLLYDFRREVETFKPDVIMASAVESTITFARELLRSIRDLGKPHVLGGVFATYAPELSINFDEVDIVCCGEGEEVIVPLARRLAAGEALEGLPNILFRDGNGNLHRSRLAPPVDVNANPRFDVTPYHESRFYRAMAGKIYRMLPVETHRGCPHRCTFCNSPLQEEMYRENTGVRYFRAKSLDKVFNDIRYFVEDCRAEYLFFWADNFMAYGKRDIDEFCDIYSNFRIPFYIQSYPTNIDEYKVKRLKDVGLDRIGMGVEHGNEDFRRNIIGRVYSNAKAIEKVKILRKYDVEYSANNIVGFPTETPDLHWDTVLLNRALEAHSASCSIFTPFYGTPLRALSLEKGYLKDADILAPTNNDYSVLEMPQFPPDVIAGKARTFNLYIKFPESRWKDVRRAEALTTEGDKIWKELKQELEATA